MPTRGLHSHPYKSFEGTELWKALNEAVENLIRNNDLQERTRREYIVGYLCKVLTEKKDEIFSLDSRP